MSVFYESLASRVKAARGERSLRDFAKICGLSHTHLDSIEKGFDPRTGKPVKVGLETLMKLSIGAGCTTNYLMGDTDDQQSGMMYYPDGRQVYTELIRSEKKRSKK